MKKIVSLMIIACVLISSMTIFAQNDATIIINGEVANIPEDMGSVVIQSDRTFVPVRFVLEYLKYGVSWKDDDQMVLGWDNSDNMFILQVGNPVLMFKSSNSTVAKKIQMDVSPFLNNDENRTYIPVRFLAEAIGYEVGYDESTSTVTLTKAQ